MFVNIPDVWWIIPDYNKAIPVNANRESRKISSHFVTSHELHAPITESLLDTYLLPLVYIIWILVSSWRESRAH